MCRLPQVDHGIEGFPPIPRVGDFARVFTTPLGATETPSLYLYKISRKSVGRYDTYDSAVVVAESEDAARHTSPDDDLEWRGRWELRESSSFDVGSSWVHPDEVTVTPLGISYLKEPGVVVASFNAG